MFVGIGNLDLGSIIVMTDSFEYRCELNFDSVQPVPISIVPVQNEQIFCVYEDRSCTWWDAADDKNPRFLEEYAGIRIWLNI